MWWKWAIHQVVPQFHCTPVRQYTSPPVWPLWAGRDVLSLRQVLQTIPLLSMQQGHVQAPSFTQPPHLWIPFKTTNLVLFWCKTRLKETLYKLVPSDTLLNCTSCLTPHLKASLHLWLTKHHPTISLHSFSFWHAVQSGMIIHFQIEPSHGLCLWAPSMLLTHLLKPAEKDKQPHF